MTQEEMQKDAYKYEPGDYIKTIGPNPNYWLVEERIWNHDVPDDWYPLEHRQYIISRVPEDIEETLQLERKTITEKDILQYESATQQEAEDHWAIR